MPSATCTVQGVLVSVFRIGREESNQLARPNTFNVQDGIWTDVFYEDEATEF